MPEDFPLACLFFPYKCQEYTFQNKFLPSANHFMVSGLYPIREDKTPWAYCQLSHECSSHVAMTSYYTLSHRVIYNDCGNGCGNSSRKARNKDMKCCVIIVGARDTLRTNHWEKLFLGYLKSGFIVIGRLYVFASQKCIVVVMLSTKHPPSVLASQYVQNSSSMRKSR